MPHSACKTEGLGSRAIWAMPKYTTCDKLIHRNIRCLKAFLIVEAIEVGVETDLIYFTDYIRGEKSVMWRNFRFL